jgi:hypothetical protein
MEGVIARGKDRAKNSSFNIISNYDRIYQHFIKLQSHILKQGANQNGPLPYSYIGT